MVVVALAVAVGGWWVAGHPGFGRSTSRVAPATETGPAGVTLPPGVTTTTILTFANFNYPIGTCVSWDQSETGSVPTSQVSCGQLHLIEVVSGPFDITGFSSYPDEAQLRTYYTQRCSAPAATFLGYALDTHGRFEASAVGPTADDWAEGHRTAWCDLQLGSFTSTLTAFAGDVRGANQESIYPIGSCGSDTTAQVSCLGPHNWQITGNVDVSGTKAFPATQTAWQALVGRQCASFATAFLGGSYPSGVESGWLTLDAGSWAAGERTVQCTVAHYPAGGGNPESFSGSLAGAGR